MISTVLPFVMAPNSRLRRIALSEGRSQFVPAGPCRHGHTSPRWSANGTCVECSRRRIVFGPFRPRKTDAERTLEAVKRYELRESRHQASIERIRDGIRVYNAARRARKAGTATGCRRAYAVFVRWVRTEPSIPCRWCRADTAPAARHIDHVVPLSRGGADAVDNLCVACPTCNLRKGSKLPGDFMREQEAAA